MQITNGDVWQATRKQGEKQEDLSSLQELLAEKWPVKTAYWLVRLARKLAGPAKDIEDVRVPLIRQYGKADDKGRISLSSEVGDLAGFVAAFNELLAQTIEIDVEKITLPESNGNTLKPATLMAMEAFLNIDEVGEVPVKAAEEAVK